MKRRKLVLASDSVRSVSGSRFVYLCNRCHKELPIDSVRAHRCPNPNRDEEIRELRAIVTKLESRIDDLERSVLRGA